MRSGFSIELALLSRLKALPLCVGGSHFHATAKKKVSPHPRTGATLISQRRLRASSGKPKRIKRLKPALNHHRLLQIPRDRDGLPQLVWFDSGEQNG